MLGRESLSVEHLTGSENDMRKGKKGKRMIYLLFISGLVITALITALAIVASNNDRDNSAGTNTHQQSNTNNKQDVCITKECVSAATYMIESIDENVNPCDDFFTFACGRWQKSRVIPEDASILRTFNEISDGVNIKLKAILEESVHDDEWKAVKKAKHYYQSCMNTSAVENRNLSDSQETIAFLGKWPVTSEQWISSHFNLEDALVKVKRYMLLPPIFSMLCQTDIKNPDSRILYIDQPSFGMPDRAYYLKGRDDPVLLAYENFAVQIAVLFGADPVTAKNDVKEIVDFEIQLANISLASSERTDIAKQYNLMEIRNLTTLYPQISWLQYFQGVFNITNLQDIALNEDEKIVNLNPDYFNKLMDIISSTQNRTIANYIIWRVVQSSVSSLPERVRALQTQYNKFLTGTTQEKPRWESCVSVTNTAFGLAVGKPFVDSHFGAEGKVDVNQMTNNLKAAMKNLISQNDWMDEETKTVAKEKVDYMEPRIGFPDVVMMESKLNKEYDMIDIHPETFYKNSVNIVFANVIKNLKQLREPVDKTKWDTAPASVNAFYQSTKNQILFPAGILQPPFYHKNYPNYLNYGGIGFVIGHEITHGFDNSGRQFDKTGKLKQWWTTTSVNNFVSKTECMINQYGNYTVEEANMNLNGKLTLGENIADNGGIKESFLAYRKLITERQNGKEELTLPGLNFTANQLFFLNAAQVWCDLVRPEKAVQMIRTDNHSNGKYRVIGPFQNFEEFSRAFNCPVGSFMNPSNKCRVW